MGKLDVGAIESLNPKQIADWTLKGTQNPSDLRYCLLEEHNVKTEVVSR